MSHFIFGKYKNKSFDSAKSDSKYINWLWLNHSSFRYDSIKYTNLIDFFKYMNFIKYWYIALDTETTGLSRSSNIVQLSWIVYDNLCNEVHRKDYIIKPENFIIPDEVIKIHGITNEIANSRGHDLPFVLSDFHTDLKSCQEIIAHNADFDISIITNTLTNLQYNDVAHSKNEQPNSINYHFFNNIIEELGKKRIFCTMKLGKRYMNLSKNPSLNTLYKHCFNDDIINAHNALYDTDHCAKCFFYMLNRKL